MKAKMRYQQDHSTFTFSDGCIATRDHFHIADLASPANIAEAVIGVITLTTLSAVHAGVGGTPIYVCLTVLASVAVGTVARVVVGVVHTGSATGTWRRITLVDTRLTVAARVSVHKYTKLQFFLFLIGL